MLVYHRLLLAPVLNIFGIIFLYSSTVLLRVVLIHEILHEYLSLNSLTVTCTVYFLQVHLYKLKASQTPVCTDSKLQNPSYKPALSTETQVAKPELSTETPVPKPALYRDPSAQTLTLYRDPSAQICTLYRDPKMYNVLSVFV